jgi:hypothetical protein
LKLLVSAGIAANLAEMTNRRTGLRPARELAGGANHPGNPA